jgi:hypothetical protein
MHRYKIKTESKQILSVVSKRQLLRIVTLKTLNISIFFFSQSESITYRVILVLDGGIQHQGDRGSCQKRRERAASRATREFLLGFFHVGQ